jgi:hypothetical protein
LFLTHTERFLIMKAPLMVIALAMTLAGCSTTSLKTADQSVVPSPTPAVTEDLTIAAEGRVPKALTIDIPAWYIKAPASTDEYVFVTGTGISTNLSMSRSKAMMDAQAQLASKINGVIDGATRQSQKDEAGDVSEDYTSQVIRRRIIETSIAGHHLEDSRVVAENKSYRTFVLVRYPVGKANQFLKKKDSGSNQSIDSAIDRELGVAPPVTQSPTATVTPVPATTVTPVPISEMKLLDVDNAEYQQRRAEALKKPGAEVYRFTLR